MPLGVARQQVQHLLLAAQRFAAALLPELHFLAQQSLDRRQIRHGKLEARAHARQFGVQFEARADEDQGAGHLAVIVGDLADQARIDRLGKIRMGVEQDVKAVMRRLARPVQKRCDTTRTA
jgi:hypothetical protein